MSNPTSVFDFSIPFETWAASTIGGGVWSDVFVTPKKDQAGLESDAVDIDEAAGVIWANAIDDFVIRVYQLHAGSEILDASSTDATPVQVKTLDTLTEDGQSVRVELEIDASDGANKFGSGRFSARYYRTGGVVNVFSIDGFFDLIGFVSANPDVQINGDDIDLFVIGEAATSIRWTIKVNRVERIQGP